MEWLKELIHQLQPVDKNAPAFWHRYSAALKEQVPGSTPLDEAEFVVFDTETTGLDPGTDKVLSMGAIKVRNLQVLVSDTFECLVQQEGAPSTKSAEVHGLLSKELDQGITEREAVEGFIDFIGSATLVGQHVAFDIAMVNQMLKRQGIRGKLRNRSVDTAHLAIRLERRHADSHTLKTGEYSLDALCERYSLPTDDRHTASGDAFTTALLLLKLLSLAKKRGVMTVRELIR
ncbi:3'-5' exonuclease [Pontibacter amylolyticus]|uniref:DNA polymerase III subunit epsilon n=1 Tax=Pontibacter amylolyticus TaxID=1424080 RepID=A0ABQ1W8I1_9BACT|nr:exonuclease domain-containing protein [Pontibacter amylolyticus]GGG19857.1 DNA polymerase III subunit epsilon [Pontibacter amylolyticus]